MTPFVVVKTDIRITRGVALWNSVIPLFVPTNILRHAIGPWRSSACAGRLPAMQEV
jgi:hypothetical protein